VSSADGDVHVRPQRPLLHFCVGDTTLDERLPQQTQEVQRMLGRTQIGIG
jgi:hypothetical protein